MTSAPGHAPEVGWTALAVRAGETLDERAEVVSALTRFQVSSISKTFVATVVASLVERGELDWSQTLDRWFPSVPLADRTTLHHLVTHTSGIGHWDCVADHAEFARMDSDARFHALRHASPVADPGERWAYSGPGYWLLAAVLETATGAEYRALVEQTILVPLALDETTVGRPDPAHADVALGDRGRDASPELALATVPGTGDLWSTVRDLTRFAAGLHGGEVVAPATLHAMTDGAVGLGSSAWTNGVATAERYGYGCYLGTVLGEAAWFHHGDNPGFRSVLVHLPRRATTLAVLSNADDVEVRDLVAQVRV